eukprot:gene8466-10398_t
MSKEYGRVFRFWIGDHYTLIVNDPVLIREIWVKNFDNFINRPHFPTLEINSNGYINLAFSDEPIWRQLKQLVGGLFTKTSLKQLAHDIIEEEVDKYIDALKEQSKYGEPVYTEPLCKKYSLNVMLNFLLSESASFNEKDPISKDCYNFIKEIDDIIQYHEAENKKSISKDQVIVLIMDLISAGTDTTSMAINYSFMCMANNPEIQEKAFQELVKCVGKGNKVKISDRQSTPYINAMMKELLRYKTIGLFGLPRVATNDITIDGIFIPGGTHLMQNIYACHHSDQYWDQPFQFNPENFLKDEKTIDNIAFIPFGVGSRNCIGSSLALDEMYCSIANILMNFQIQSVDGNKIDESEVNSPKYEIKVKLIPRN